MQSPRRRIRVVSVGKTLFGYGKNDGISHSFALSDKAQESNI